MLRLVDLWPVGTRGPPGYLSVPASDFPRGDDIDEDGELAESLHRVLATLIKVREARTPLPAERLRERLELVQWLRGELAAVEHLLAGEYDKVRRAGPAVPVAGGAPTAG